MGVFASIDTNENGVLEKEEVLAVARNASEPLKEFCRQVPSLQHFLEVDSWESRFKEMDTDKDGVISWFEFLRFFSWIGSASLPPASTTLIPAEDLIALFVCLDKNKNGSLEKEEILSAVTQKDPGLVEYCRQVPAMQPLLAADKWEESFRKLDTDQDGKVSWHEFMNFFRGK